MTLKRGVVVARAEPITDHLIKDSDQLDHSPMPEVNNLQTGEFDIKAPDEYQPLVKDLNTKNIDLFAQSDADLGRTETVKMKKDTGDNSPETPLPDTIKQNKKYIPSSWRDVGSKGDRTISIPVVFPHGHCEEGRWKHRPCID